MTTDAKKRPGRRPGPRPETWRSGPDPVRHAQFHAWGVARAQARYRGEAWELTAEEWCTAWGDQWHLRGRHSHSWYLVRRDWHLPWRADNIKVVDRHEFLYRQCLIKRERGMIKNIRMTP
jgi:hypothetical protein